MLGGVYYIKNVEAGDSTTELVLTARLVFSGALSALERAKAHTLPGHRPQVRTR